MEMPYTFIYTIALTDEEKNKLQKILAPNDNIELRHLETLEDLSLYLKKVAVNYLITNKNFNKKSNDFFINENKGFFINVNLLLFSYENDSLEEFSKYRSLLKSIQPFESSLGLIDQATKLSDFINDEQSSLNPIYLPLSIKLFKSISSAPCDLYIKLSDKKFVKILSKNESEHVQEIIEKYAKKDVSEIYLESKHLNKVKDILTKLIFKIDDNKSNKSEQKLQIAENVINVVKDFGVSDFLLEGINDTFSELSHEMSNDKKLAGLLALVNNNTNNTISNHCYLTAVFSTMIVNKVSWNNATIRKNLCTAAILHDLDIVESLDSLYEFKSLDEINQLPSKKRQIFSQHAVTTANLLAKNNNIATDIINIIARHHEGAGNLSYPQGLQASTLTPPSCLFNVAHQFSIELTKIAFNQNKINVAFEHLKAHYSANIFRPFIEILEKELKANS